MRLAVAGNSMRSAMMRLGAFSRHTWLQQLLKSKWNDLVSNERLHDLIGDSGCFNTNTILKYQSEWLAHLVRQSATNTALLGGMRVTRVAVVDRALASVMMPLASGVV